MRFQLRGERVLLLERVQTECFSENETETFMETVLLQPGWKVEEDEDKREERRGVGGRREGEG